MTRWVIECKDWASPVTKEKVLALRAVVDDVGADRGILISVSGFQPGAVTAAQKTNVTLTDFEGLKANAHQELIAAILGRLETQIIELQQGLHDLYQSEQKGPHSWISKPLEGVDAQAVVQAISSLAVLEYGFKRIRLNQPPFPVTFDESGNRMVKVDTLEEFVSAACEVVNLTEVVLKEQQKNLERQ